MAGAVNRNPGLEVLSTAGAPPLRPALCLCLAALLCSCAPPVNRDLDALASSIRARASAVQTLKDRGKIREDGRGFLRPNPGVYLDIPDRRVVEEENYERRKVFALLARQYKLPQKNIEAIFGKLSQPAAQAQP